jgi:hypothetical protein
MHVSLITIAVFLFGTYYIIAYPSHVSVPVIVCILSIISSNTKVVFLIFPVLYCTGKIRSIPVWVAGQVVEWSPGRILC